MRKIQSALAGFLLAGVAMGCTPVQKGDLANWLGLLANPGSSNSTSGQSYTVGGTLSGLAGGSLKLRLNGSEEIGLTANGPFKFPTKLTDGTFYFVELIEGPVGFAQVCTLSGNTGTVSGANATSTVVCANNAFSISGQVSGLTGTGLKIKNNGADEISVSANGAFAFPAAVANGAMYNVQVSQNPTGQTCTASSNVGLIAGSDINGIGVTCSAKSYSINALVLVAGLDGALELTLNGQETKSLSFAYALGGFPPGFSMGQQATVNFLTPLAEGASYTIAISQRTGGPNPAINNWVSQTCTINGQSSITGTVTGGGWDVVLTVNCSTTPYVFDPNIGITWMRCSQGQTNPLHNAESCQGTGANAPWGASMLKFCSANDNSCNDAYAGGMFPVVKGHLNGDGSSEAYTSCNSLNASGGTYGKTNWRLPRMSELASLVNYDILENTDGAVPAISPALFPDSVGDWYWSSSAGPDDAHAWAVNFQTGMLGSKSKTDSAYVRCVAGP